MPEIEVIGLYKIIPTEQSIIQAARYHEFNWLIDDGKYVDKINWNDHKNLGLVEMMVSTSPSPNDLMGSISLDDQAPYMEYYLDSTGHKLITEIQVIEYEAYRICFFIHFVDRIKPLKIGTERLSLPAWNELPERLIPFTHYLPVG